jgi:uncharacterized protein (TIGR00369 family)
MDRDHLLHVIERDIPFNGYLGIRLGDCGPGWAELLLPFRPEFVGDVRRPAIHGGVISALLDTAGGAAAMTVLEPSDRISTVDLRVDFLLPGESRDLIAKAWIIRKGNRVIVITGRAHHGDETTPVAEIRAVYNLGRARRAETP